MTVKITALGGGFSGIFPGPGYFPDGSLAAPSIAFINETTLGFFRPRNGVIELTGGSLAVGQIPVTLTPRLWSGDNVTFQAPGPAFAQAILTGNAAHPIALNTVTDMTSGGIGAYGLYSTLQFRNATGTGIGAGILGEIWSNSAGNQGAVSAITAQGSKYGAGTMASFAGLYVPPTYVDALSGPLTANYGLLVDAQGGGVNNWNIYSGEAGSTFSAASAGSLAKAANALVSSDGQNGLVAISEYSGATSFTNGTGVVAIGSGVGLNPPGYSLGVLAIGAMNGTGTLSASIALEAGIQINSGTITSAFGAYIDPPSGAGAVTNLYGLYVDDQTAGSTLSYSIFTKSGLVHLGDSVSIASTTDPVSSYYNLWSGPVTASYDSGGFVTAFASSAANVLGNLNTQAKTGVLAINQTTSSAGGEVYGLVALGEALATNTAAGGVYARGSTLGTASPAIAELFGLNVSIYQGSNGTTSNGYGVHVLAGSLTAGVLTNQYGIRIEDQALGSTLNFSIYGGAGFYRFFDHVGLNSNPTTTSPVNIASLPTSAAGLAAGDVWVDTTGALNILKIV